MFCMVFKSLQSHMIPEDEAFSSKHVMNYLSLEMYERIIYHSHLNGLDKKQQFCYLGSKTKSLHYLLRKKSSTQNDYWLNLNLGYFNV